VKPEGVFHWGAEGDHFTGVSKEFLEIKQKRQEVHIDLLPFTLCAMFTPPAP
jgi:hypothetical protein